MDVEPESRSVMFTDLLKERVTNWLDAEETSVLRAYVISTLSIWDVWWEWDTWELRWKKTKLTLFSRQQDLCK